MLLRPNSEQENLISKGPFHLPLLIADGMKMLKEEDRPVNMVFCQNSHCFTWVTTPVGLI